MFSYVLKVFYLVSFLALCKGCRRVVFNSKEGNAVMNNSTAVLRAHMSQCIYNITYNRVFPVLDVQSIVDFSVLHTTWFNDTAEQFCRLSPARNTRCWINRLQLYLSRRSPFYQPVRRCIYSYRRRATINRRAPPPKRTQSSVNSIASDDLELARFSNCVTNDVTLPSNQHQNMTSVLKFFKFHSAAENRNRRRNEVDDNWKENIFQITRLDSPFYLSFIRCKAYIAFNLCNQSRDSVTEVTGMEVTEEQNVTYSNNLSPSPPPPPPRVAVNSIILGTPPKITCNVSEISINGIFNESTWNFGETLI
ncbi:uncharacterized protein LOC144744826 [Ciona intestinalis]